MIGALSVCAVLGVGTILGRYSDRISFWIALAGVAGAHSLFVLLINWPREFHGAGIIFAPLVIGDMYASAKIILSVVKRSDS